MSTRYTETYLRTKGRAARGRRNASELLLEDMRKAASQQGWDIFLSHSFKDKDDEVLLGLVSEFESQGLSVFLDWRSEAQLDRTKVDTASADTLRERMKASKCLVFAYSENAAHSAWVPWELGYSDATSGRVAVAPIAPDLAHASGKTTGQEYLGLYPILAHGRDTTLKQRVWVRDWENSSYYVEFNAWLEGSELCQH